MLIGLGKMIKKVVEVITGNLLASKLLGFTYSPGGGSSYYTTTEGANTDGVIAVTLNGAIKYTTDSGQTWNNANPFNLNSTTDWVMNWWDKFYINGKYVFMGQSKHAMATSTDGVNWDIKKSGLQYWTPETFDYNYSYPVDGGKLFAFGAINSTENSPNLFYSTDGGDNFNVTSVGIQNHQNAQLTGYPEVQYSEYSSGKYLLIDTNATSGNRAYTSSDGENWTASLDPEDFLLDSVSVETGQRFATPVFNKAYGWVTAGTDGSTFVSPDGVNWSLGDKIPNISLDVDDPNIRISLHRVGTEKSGSPYTLSVVLVIDEAIYNQSQGIYDYSTRVFHSPSGYNWTEIDWATSVGATAINTTPEQLRALEFLEIQSNYHEEEQTYVLNMFNGFPGYTLWSTDGINWVSYSGNQYTTSIYNGVYYSNGKFYSYSQDGQIYVSDNGANWSNTGESGNFNDFVNSSAISEYFQGSGFFSGPISTLREVQVAIGNQGEEGAEILAPVDVYTVPALTTTDIDEVRVKNTSASTITYDLGVLNDGVSLTDQNALINDQAISAGATATVTNISNPLTSGQRIVVLPSAVDAVEVKVYGTETVVLPQLTLDFSGMSTGWSIASNDQVSGNLKFRFMMTAADTARFATPSPDNSGWIGATFTISNPTPYMGGTIPAVLSQTFTVTASSVIDNGPMGFVVDLTTSNTTNLDGVFDFNGTASVVLP